MNTTSLAVTVLIAAMAIAGTVSSGSQFTGSTTEQLHELACTQPSKSDNPWNIKNLYDCRTRTFYVPHQLWTGGKWDGVKYSASDGAPDDTCLFQASASYSGTGVAEIQPAACRDKGIVQISDKSGERPFAKEAKDAKDRCNFPAGHGWALSVRRDCADATLEITSIKLNGRNELESVEFNRWRGNSLENRLRYIPNKGTTDAWGY